MADTFTPDEVVLAAQAGYEAMPHIVEWRDLFPEERFDWIGMMHAALDAITTHRQGGRASDEQHPANWHG